MKTRSFGIGSGPSQAKRAVARWFAAVFVLSVANLAAAQPATPSDPQQDEPALQFVGTCAGCHTIGGGPMRGPDLANTAPWPEAQLASAVQSMQRKVGPLSPAQTAALVQLLKDPNVKARVKEARAKLIDDSQVEAEPTNSLFGGALFFGKSALQNGGLPCNSCHRFRGEGGDLGPNLSDFAALSETETLAATISRASFPVMRSAYQSKPITLQEARHIAAFMKQAKAERRIWASSVSTGTGIGLGFSAFFGVLLYILARPKGIRAELVQRASKR